MISMLWSNPIEFLGFLVAFALAIMLHEIAHGYAAMRNGDNTAKYMNRMNLNPLNHFDLFGFLMFLCIGFGYAKPVPIDSRNFDNYKKGMFEVSIAGVLMNFILAFLATPLFMLALKYLPDLLLFDEFFVAILKYSITLNIMFMVFNLMPIYPLDGFRLVELFTRPQNAFVRFMYRNSRYVMLGFILVVFVFNINILGFFSQYVVSFLFKIWSFVL